MKINPYTNAIYATTYICCIAIIFQYMSKNHQDVPGSIINPIVALSMLVFSVAFMSFIFFYKPVTLLLENKKDEALNFFLKTLGTFGIMTIGALLLLNLS